MWYLSIGTTGSCDGPGPVKTLGRKIFERSTALIHFVAYNYYQLAFFLEYVKRYRW